MPLTGYLLADFFDGAITALEVGFPQICTREPLPHPSAEGRTISALRLSAAADGTKPAIVVLGGVHSRELAPPDALLVFAFRLSRAYSQGTGVAFGNHSYGAATVQTLLNELELHIVPIVNPDGRAFIQSGGDPMWRKNRRPTKGTECIGTDINRNYDFLHKSGIGTSADPCDFQLFRGKKPFSEPETRNVRDLIDGLPNLEGLLDVHSFMNPPAVLLPWGDDDVQTFRVDENFQNPAFDGKRGNPNDLVYQEFMPITDLYWFRTTGEAMKQAMTAARGRAHQVIHITFIGSTGVTGSSVDYAYSRNFLPGANPDVLPMALEVGTEFQPTMQDAAQVYEEVGAGVVQYCLSIHSFVESLIGATVPPAHQDAVRELLLLLRQTSGWLEDLMGQVEAATESFLRAVSDVQDLRDGVPAIIEQFASLFEAGEGPLTVMPRDLLVELDQLLADIAKEENPAAELSALIDTVREKLPWFADATIVEGLARVDSPFPPFPPIPPF